MKIDTDARLDIQKGIKWYNKKAIGLGRKFHKEVKQHFKILRRMPYFQLYYYDVRCLPLKIFPYMIHFTLDEKDKIIIVRAVFPSQVNPENWKKRITK
ncbi:MAG: hypothetical protein WD048_01395 [Chitinophagales bacterium]